MKDFALSCTAALLNLKHGRIISAVRSLKREGVHRRRWAEDSRVILMLGGDGAGRQLMEQKLREEK